MKKAAGIASGKMLDYGVRKEGRDRDRKEERESDGEENSGCLVTYKNL